MRMCTKTVLKEATRLVEKGDLAINHPMGRSVLFDVRYLSSYHIRHVWNFRDLAIIFSVSSVFRHIFSTNLFVCPSILILDELEGYLLHFNYIFAPLNPQILNIFIPLHQCISNQTFNQVPPPHPHILISGIALRSGMINVPLFSKFLLFVSKITKTKCSIFLCSQHILDMLFKAVSLSFCIIS